MRNDQDDLRPRVIKRGAFTVLLLAASVQPSYAYIDPGTGSMLLQMAIAGIAGALFFFRQLRIQFVSWFRRTVLGRAEPEQVTNQVAPTAGTDSD